MTSYLITGGSGSLGRALAHRLLVSDAADRIIIYSRNEHTQEGMARDLAPLDPHKRLRFRVGDVRDLRRLTMAMDRVDVVVHAAAMKIMPKCESDPFEAVQTNIVGAQNVIEAAISSSVKRVVAISTDKACLPCNLYGATKLCAEKLFTAASVYAGARDVRFATVRYGNVSGSQSSVIPLWRELLRKGATKLPVTSPFCTRYWLTLDEAVDLVLWTANHIQGGEIVVPDMPAYQISTLVDAFGSVPDIIGLRPGEKVAEQMINEHEYHLFRRVDRYWMTGSEDRSSVHLSGPMASDTATRMSVGELRGKLAEFGFELREAA